MISLVTPQPLTEAVANLSQRTPIGSALKSTDWLRVPLSLRESAFFSARVESARILQFMKDKLDASIAMSRGKVARGEALVDRSSFIGDVKKLLVELGYKPTPGEEGTITDLSTRRRLGLIFDMNIQAAEGFSAWKVGQAPDLLNAMPAQELIRVESRVNPRDWIKRWTKAGGKLFDGGRMIALKNDGIWVRISRFGRPWEPFDYGSGMGREDIDRFEAEDFGLIEPDEVVQPVDKAFTEGLEASVRGLDARLVSALQTIFGDQVEFTNDSAKWVGGRN